MKGGSRTIIDLNGEWELQPGLETAPGEFSHRVQVPSVVDCATSSYEWRDFDYHWYRKSFVVSDSEKGRAAFLRIEQSMFGTAVWVNGNFAGESISCYTSQEYRIEPFLNYGSQNRILIRVGQRSALPAESAVGKDQERRSFIPGIWGDVKVVCTGVVRVKLVQTLPRVGESILDVNVWLENIGETPREVKLTAQVTEKVSGKSASDPISEKSRLEALSEMKLSLSLPVASAKLWSPESPFLYVFTATVSGDTVDLFDEHRVVFGMREFEIRGSDFLLNGKTIYLRGSNIAFHRFLSDGDRRLLPWNEKWIRKALVDIPKEHNFNFFRAHLGHMYNRWYDIADEGGILLQDEWQFWGATGSKEQITEEFSDWLKDNWNHPSIVIWDALNESSDSVVQDEIIPDMKKLDPTRLWESHDFFEDHPYIYSLGPVLIDRKFGYTRSLEDIRNSERPSQVNEYLWWWLDKDNRPSELTRKVVTRWLGSDYSHSELVEHQSFLASELTELFRRLDVKCIQPFVYLSANEGPTSHWFVGDIAELKAKPVLAAIGKAFEPFGVSIELWDRHFFEGETRRLTIYVFNDYPDESDGIVKAGLKDSSHKWLISEDIPVRVDGSGTLKKTFDITFPTSPGDYFIAVEVLNSRTGRMSVSEKVCRVYATPLVPALPDTRGISLLDPSGEVQGFLAFCGLPVISFDGSFDSTISLLMIVGRGILDDSFSANRKDIFRWVEDGGILIIIQPEQGAAPRLEIELPAGLSMTVEAREDRDQGGYDSYVIASENLHPLWDGIEKADLRMFNGGYGGEMVPQSDLIFRGKHEVLARSGLGLARPVVVHAAAGRGSVVVNSLEIVGRLLPKEGSYDDLYAPRPDPVAMKFLLNLVALCSRASSRGTARPNPGEAIAKL